MDDPIELVLNDKVSTAIETVGNVFDSIEHILTGVPAPIRKNATLAFARLCTAAVEYPLACLEGAATERRARTAASVALTKVTAEKIAEQMRIDPVYARAAGSKYAQK